MRRLRKNYRVLVVVAVLQCLLLQVAAPSLTRGLAGEPVGTGTAAVGGGTTGGSMYEGVEHSGHEHEEVGIPGDDEIIEILHIVERLKETKNPIWPFLLTASATLLALHQTIHTWKDMVHQRRHLELEAAHAGHSLHDREHALSKIKEIDAKLVEIEKELRSKEATFSEHLKDLKSKGKNLKGETRSAFDRVMGTMEKMSSRTGRPHPMAAHTVDRWLESPAGKEARQHPAVEKWAREYETARDAIKAQQLDFEVKLQEGAAKVASFSGDRKEHLSLAARQTPGSPVAREDGFGRPDPQGHLTRGQAVTYVSRETEYCEASYSAAAHEQSQAAQLARPANFYSTPGNYKFLAMQGGVAGLLAAGATYAYSRFRHTTGGQDAFHSELDRRLRFNVDWDAKKDILYQLSSPEGRKEMRPYFESLYKVLNSPKFSGRIRDYVKQRLQVRGLEQVANEEYLSRMEDPDKVATSGMVNLALTARNVGSWNMTRKQMQAILSSNSKMDPHMREMFLSTFVDQLPGTIWSTTLRGESLVDPKLRMELVEALESELSDVKFNVDPDTVIAFPGKTRVVTPGHEGHGESQQAKEHHKPKKKSEPVPTGVLAVDHD